MRNSWRLLAFVLGAFTLSTCERSTPPAADVAMLHMVEERFEQSVEMELESELYVRARLKPGVRLSHADLDRLYAAFFLLPDGQRRETEYVYLNVYDADGRFLEQLAYDMSLQKIIRSRTEHY